MRALLLVALTAGCGRLFGLDDPQPVASADAASDAGVGSGDARTCAGKYGPGGAGLLEYCGSLDGPALAVSGTLDTSNDAGCTRVLQLDALTSACALIGSTVQIGDLTVTGARPLVVVSRDQLSVNGTVRVTAGTNPTACASGGALDGTGTASGGAGGSFVGRGGTGGSDSSGVGGTPGLTQQPTTVRGGCRGGNGAGGGGNGGAGGGALYLISASTIAVTGGIDASGRGGQGGAGALLMPAGGGGGGSGGLIGLDSPSITLASTSVLVANGGGGGGGAAMNSTGQDGASTSLFAPTVRPAGGAGGGSAQKGGAGAAGVVLDGESLGPSANPGGGGGGGGAGAIELYGTTITKQGVISPPVAD